MNNPRIVPEVRNMNTYSVTYIQKSGTPLTIMVEVDGNDLDAIIAAANELDDAGLLADLPAQTPDVCKLRTVPTTPSKMDRNREEAVDALYKYGIGGDLAQTLLDITENNHRTLVWDNVGVSFDDEPGPSQGFWVSADVKVKRTAKATREEAIGWVMKIVFNRNGDMILTNADQIGILVNSLLTLGRTDRWREAVNHWYQMVTSQKARSAEDHLRWAVLQYAIQTSWAV
jgi:hypothetical protein